MGVISLLTKWLYLEKEKPLLALQQEVKFAIWSQLPAESQFSAFPQKVGDWGAFLSFLFFFFQFVILFLNLFFNWKRIALKYCVCFYCPTIQISCNYSYIIFGTSLLFPQSTPLGHQKAPGWAPYVLQQLLTSYLFYTGLCMYVDATFSVCPTLFHPLLCPRVSSLYLHLHSFPCKQSFND